MSQRKEFSQKGGSACLLESSFCCDKAAVQEDLLTPGTASCLAFEEWLARCRSRSPADPANTEAHTSSWKGCPYTAATVETICVNRISQVGKYKSVREMEIIRPIP